MEVDCVHIDASPKARRRIAPDCPLQKGIRCAAERRWRARRPTGVQRRMIEAGALWGASVTFECSNMPSVGHGHKKTSRSDEKLNF